MKEGRSMSSCSGSMPRAAPPVLRHFHGLKGRLWRWEMETDVMPAPSRCAGSDAWRAR